MSTLLSLLAVPAFYVVTDRMKERLRGQAATPVAAAHAVEHG